MAGGLFVLPKMYKITQNSLLKKHGIFCLTFSLKKKVKFVLTCATEFGTICKSAIGRILPYLRDIAMNREIAQVSEVTFGEYVRTSGG